MTIIIINSNSIIIIHYHSRFVILSGARAALDCGLLRNSDWTSAWGRGQEGG